MSWIRKLNNDQDTHTNYQKLRLSPLASKKAHR
jgi:hypothetical protein